MSTSGGGDGFSSGPGGGGLGAGLEGLPIKNIKRDEDRRMSAAGSVSDSMIATTSNKRNNQSTSSTTTSKENKRPLSAVLSEDCPPSSSPISTNQPVRQSFLSKLTRAEGSKSTNNNINSNNSKKDPKKIDIKGVPSALNTASETSQSSQPTSIAARSFFYGTECDKYNINSTAASFDTCKNVKNDLEEHSSIDEQNQSKMNMIARGGSNNGPNNEPIVKSIKQQITLTSEQKKPADFKLNTIKYDENPKDITDSHRNDNSDNFDVTVDEVKVDTDVDDDDNQVIPSWPSRSDAPKINSEFIQHKVYSLKDYSQVASPTIPPISALSSSRGSITGATSFSPAGKFQKSMSQDRKFKANTKRMSECIYSSQIGNVQNIDPQASKIFSKNFSVSPSPQSSNSHKKQQNPSQVGQSVPTTSFSISSSGEGTLLPNTRHAVLLNESRIDRMRKLFVSPLSLRSGSKNSISSGSANVQTRLSFQSGASMLNKPHHLMHAMYRTGGTSAHLSRRSPMRQKQGKSFKVYGCPLQMANNIYPITCFGRADIYKQQSVPYILARLCNYIEENSSQLTHEGIFRVSGNARLMEKLRTLFDHLGDAPLESESVDVATSASMLKMYLRELPEPLIPTRMNYYFITLAKKYSLLLTKDNVSSYSRILSTSAQSSSTTTETSENLALYERQRLAFSRDLTKLLRKLPIENYNLLKYLACFLHRISLKQRYNKMCAEALGIVFGPNVFRIRSESYKGLKEQELSNQIMASIISNYKFIFDSELTDPLGNVVDGDETFELERMSQTNRSRKGQHTDSSSKTSESVIFVSKGGHAPGNNGVSPVSTTLSVPTVSKPSPLKSSELKQASRRSHVCCPRHCDGYTMDDDEGEENDQLSGERGDFESRVTQDARRNEEEDVVDDDDDCDDGESYTPSSGSGSYCSSMDSESIESSFDGEIDQDNAEVDVDNMDLASQSNNSSSECVSDTSYTPTSSHSNSMVHDDEDDDEDDDQGEDEERGEESFYGNSSSFESSPSFGRLIDSKKDNQSSCLVCKRRESAALVGENLTNKSTSMAQVSDNKIGPNKTNYPADVMDNESNQNIPEVNMDLSKFDKNLDEKQQDMANKSKTVPTDPLNANLQLPSTTRTSRKKRDVVKRSQHSTNANQNLIIASTLAGNSETKINILGDGETLLTTMDSKVTSNPSNLAPATTRVHTTSIRHSEASSNNKVRHPSGRQAHRFDFFRRRSSSASSLGRIKHKRDQFVAATQRKTSKEDSQQHHIKESRIQTSDKRRLHDHIGKGSSGHSSTRRSRGKGQSGRKLTTSNIGPNSANESSHASTSSQPYPVTTSTNRAFERSGGYKNSLHIRDAHHRSNRQKPQAEFYYGHDNMSALNLSTQYVVPDPYLSCDFLSARYLEELDCDKYFLLRSFNSDETLLRSSSFFSEFPLEHCNIQSRPRRFSGHDFEEKLNIIQLPCRPCDQIFEGFEEEIVAPPAEHLGAVIDLDKSQDCAGAIPTQVVQPVEITFKTSFISLLDNRLTGFRKSELSINDAISSNQDDHILTQMKATKALVKALKRVLNHGITKGYSDQMVTLVQNLSDDSTSPAYVDDPSTCYVDYLSADSLVDEITRILENQGKVMASHSSDLSQFNNVLSMKITLFKQRYNDLKNIRDHYLKNHIEQTQSKHTLKSVQVASEETNLPESDKKKKHGSLDTLRPSATGVQQQRKLSAPSRQPNLNEEENVSGDKRDANDGGKVGVEMTDPRRESTDYKVRPQIECKSSNENIVKSRCHFGSLCPVEFVFNIEKLLASKRTLGSRLVKLNEMTTEQLQSEKLELQKNLLRYEHWFGRPVTRLEFSLVGHLYERYRAVKMIKSRKQETFAEVS